MMLKATKIEQFSENSILPVSQFNPDIVSDYTIKHVSSEDVVSLFFYFDHITKFISCAIVI